MKKIAMFIAAAAIAVSASAQRTTITANKAGDNIYVGINGGAITGLKNNFKNYGLTDKKNAFSVFSPEFGVRVGKNFTTVFGLALDANLYFNAVKKTSPFRLSKTFVQGLDVDLLGTANLMNLFAGYKGEPRFFEIIALGGFGWTHGFNIYNVKKVNAINSKVALDFALNLGEKKAWQVYIEPAIIWALNGTGYDAVEYNLNKSMVQLNAGIVYKFRNSNGTHNFTIAPGRDQAEIDALNAQINSLRDELARKPKEVIKEVIKEVPTTTVQEVKVEDLVFVTFAQGKSELTFDAKTALNNIKEGRHVQIVGTASPEGNPELNQRLSQARANVVADYLKTRGVVVDEATGKGVQGTTSNRLAIVYVK